MPRGRPRANKTDCNSDVNTKPKEKRVRSENAFTASSGEKMPRRAASNKLYVKIEEDEIANDYPLPAYYKPTAGETSVMTTDDGSGFCLDVDPSESSSSGAPNVDGIPVYLSAIKEWVVEFGYSMILISFRTDTAWKVNHLSVSHGTNMPLYTGGIDLESHQHSMPHGTNQVLKTARLAVAIITLLKDQARASRLSFTDVIKRVSEFNPNDPAYISSNPSTVERHVVVHGQIILQQFSEFPDETIRKCAFVTGLRVKMEERHHTKWLVKKKVVLKKEANLNPRATMEPVDIGIQEESNASNNDKVHK
ncbi:hypothetical protein Dsin_030595 [Dipteronia sinensis]|uniref:Uncharacterized protein n=1 Tax=Dipteronia sinensis TaxID=43782 RepID=A0AAD9ZL86_9ROSI|nr:hypothetical protein Dsin_030595 [Dipteronia sinensis]